jgi:hypothetical protein
MRLVDTTTMRGAALIGAAPVNQFYNWRTVPDASFSDVVRPNADTLYSSM